ncbi:MAG: ribonucleoside-triphosphate reductase, partial [bacterium]|nr:ribonucleoside-triphosphate reductase [bacterium]
FVLGLTAWFDGKDIKFDYSQIRLAGARLETAGGKASGPQPLMDLMEFAKRKILAKQGRRLSNIDMHDVICQIGMIVVAGGVRRSALISLSELEDTEMRDAKKGQFYLTEGQRSMANNSAVYNAKPGAEEFLDEWTSLVKSKSGERGIFNRAGLEKQVPARRWAAIKDERQMGLNPCGEIYLRSKQFCNLTSIVIRPKDTVATLKRKMELATLLGTYQSTLTNFGYLSKKWKENCEEERLLGVSLTGYYDNPIIRTDKVLDTLKADSVETNKKYAKRFGINPSTAITCVKPHGNSGQLLGVGSGMHPWFAPYFIRRVRISHTDTLLQMARDQGVPCVPEVGQAEGSATTYVLEFPVKAPEGAIFKDEVSALDLMKEWKRLKEHFVEHNPSATIYVGPDEWIAVGNFVYENWDWIGGLSFLPRSEHVYQLAPYEPITKAEYERRARAIGTIDFSKLSQYEAQDNTTGAKEFACVSGVCEI